MAVLEAKERTEGQGFGLRKIRLQGNIPGVLYGKNVKNRVVYMNAADFLKTVREAGRNGLITLKVNGESHSALLRDIQKDPIRNEIIHVDFQVVDMSTEVDVAVNVHLVGNAAGVKDGGVLQQSLHQLSIRALPANIPSSIDIDISTLQVGETITVGDVQTGGMYEINHGSEEVIASILPPKQEEEIHSGEQQEPGHPEAEEGRETTPES
ncbi:ribosomal protein L25, Ctc-form [Anoxybacillus sp. B7M1]|jgi:large subunit ribosomal protein L25|uniref:50S ribosomal protein L25/general stress protein Ctc n=1 Tax=unclassified Anoxybacillus TaxID=2639704 RepID=UPI0005CD7EB5|nr:MULTISPECIES: 50S ribosomal protein L25/general stress protein Ctc [unclassified Anoxybacillus]ANB57046.1 ribosomal protein L25, Ctc-form [Anoxybacillus sp. B2M1]ANB63831.1 ribosomal protein L25, Ctc-form [Anoxybacillus sp. B7M1]